MSKAIIVMDMPRSCNVCPFCTIIGFDSVCTIPGSEDDDGCYRDVYHYTSGRPDSAH